MNAKWIVFAIISSILFLMLENTPESIHGSICAWVIQFSGACPSWLDIPWVVAAIKIITAIFIVGSILGAVLESIYRKRTEKKKARESVETISGYKALIWLTEARSSSYETTAIELADAARLGRLHAWGRPMPKMAIPVHMSAIEPIPPDVWAYAVLDASLIPDPLSSSGMVYRQQYVKSYTKDDRTLYDAVRFKKKEMMNLYNEQSASKHLE